MKFIRVVLLVFIVFAFEIFAKPITINFQNTPIVDIIKFVAKEKHMNVLMNERISGKVNFLSNKPIDDSELIPFLEHILMVKGYALSASNDGYLVIVRAARASKEVGINTKSKVGMKMVVLRPNYIKPSVVAGKIKHLASQYSLITYDDKMDLLIISDYPKNIKNMRKLLALFDTHLKRELRRVKIEHYSVKKAIPKLNKIFQATQDDYTSDIKLLSDEYQNAIWISANSEDIDKAVKFIKKFDNEAQDSAKMQTEIVFLKNANVEDIIKTAKEIVKSKDIDRPIKSVITSNKELNALIVSSTKAQINEIKDIVKILDIERKQVFIKVQIFEISKNSLDQLGIKWGAAGGFAENGVVATSAVNMGGQAFVLPSILTNNIDMGNVDAGVAIGATVDFLSQEGAINVVSEPNLLSVNNLKSSIYVGKTQSIKTGDSTGSNKDDVTRSTYTREDIGLTLEITPQITDKDNVVLKIMVNVEDVDRGSTAHADQPTTTKRKIMTTAIVQNEDSIIIGGLLRDSLSRSQTKVPLLGDIPFLGALFRNSSDSYDKISTVMILTPYIVSSSRELTKLQKKLKEMEDTKQEISMKMQRALEKIKNDQAKSHSPEDEVF